MLEEKQNQAHSLFLLHLFVLHFVYDEQPQQQGARENAAPAGTATATPQTTCEQGSNCTDQQSSSEKKIIIIGKNIVINKQ
jgi:hypothetical protein